MQEIKCPNCGEVFTVDESGYAQIASQIRDKEFKKELERCEKELNSKKEMDIQLLKMQQEHSQKEMLSKNEEKLAEKDRLITELQNKLKNGETEKKLAVSEAIQQKEKEILTEKDGQLAEKEQLIIELQKKISNGETEKKLAVSEAIQKKDKEISNKDTELTKLRGELKNKDNESMLEVKSIREKYEGELKLKDEQIELYKDFKAKQSTKMVGESLEQHCLTQFNQIRMTAFPTAYFEKDNDAADGTKGDFIFRESAEDGLEFISIMFEMKNEMDTTAAKHKNEDFFDKLDKDRKKKNCEYAVLVSMLEMNNELYNNGIVDVSYKYEKMYVIRPQFFIPIITLLRNAALNSLKYQRELQIVRNQQLDITHFEENMQEFKDKFGRNYDIASRRFKDAINEIEKSIKQLEKVKEALTTSENQLRLANDKAQDLSIKRLTKNAPSVKEMFDELNSRSK